ncbi:MAG: copper chaperone PCu(A)C [Pseudomonadota bacterium]
MIFHRLFAAILGLILFAAAMAPASAHEFAKGDLMIDHPAARPNLPNRPVAAYMVIMNNGAEDDRLLSATSPSFGAVELHMSSMENGVMRMEQQDAIVIPANGQTALEPGGLHLMLFKAEKAFKEGDSYPLTLTFEKAGDVEVTVNVEKIVAGEKETDHSNHGN